MSGAFLRLEEGYENALKDYYKKQIAQLNSLIVLLLGNLTKGERQKVPMIIYNILCSGYVHLHNRCSQSGHC